jgi:hypothetical protein
VDVHENGMWSPPIAWAGPYTASAFWQGDGATKSFLDSTTSGDFTVCALVKPGAHPAYTPNKIIVANGKPEGFQSDVGGWSLMQMHRCDCFHYHDDLFAGCVDMGNGTRWCTSHGEWMSPICGGLSADAMASLEWSWECGGRNGAGLGIFRDRTGMAEVYTMGGQPMGPVGTFQVSTQYPTIGNYADGSGPLWDGGVYEIIISSLPATPGNMRAIVERAAGGLLDDNGGPVPLPGADGAVHLAATSALRVNGDGSVTQDWPILLSGSIGAPASAGECFGYELAADDWSAVPGWLRPVGIYDANELPVAMVTWADPVSNHMLQIFANGSVFSVSGQPPGAFTPGSRHRTLWCFDPADGKVRGYADGGATPFAVSADALAPAAFPDLADNATNVRLQMMTAGVRAFRFWACPGASPASCW